VAIDSHGADAMRFTLASMTTDTQDIRMPVEEMTLPDGRKVNTSPKFDIGRNFCNKLWNASRFDADKLTVEDRWILSRLAETIAEVTEALDAFKYSEPMTSLYRFFWNDFCDWYLEWAKLRMQDEAQKLITQNILAFVLDQTLRLLHPFIPFITEGIFQRLNKTAPVRGLAGIAEAMPSDALVVAEWPSRIDSLRAASAEKEIEIVQGVIRTVRDIRSDRNISPKEQLTVSAKCDGEGAEILRRNARLIEHLAGLKQLEAGPDVEKPANAAIGLAESTQVFVHDAIDPAAERMKLEKEKQKTQNAKAAVEAKLSNENFVNKAKPEVVAQARERLAELSRQKMELEAELSRIIIDEQSDQQIIVIKEVNGDRSFPIVIGIVEILAIDRRLKGIEPPRPMTHDLLGNVIQQLGGKLEKIVISDLRHHTFFAKLHISVDGKKIEIDSRPSDAIALGVAQHTPIYVAEEVFDLTSQ